VKRRCEWSGVRGGEGEGEAEGEADQKMAPNGMSSAPERPRVPFIARRESTRLKYCTVEKVARRRTTHERRR
jgi:hypothetical protein